MIEFFLAMIGSWFYFAVPAVLVCSPFWIFGRRHAGWTWPDFLILIIPWLVWVLVFTFLSRYASLASALVESVSLGCLTVIAPILRLIVKRKWSVQRTRLIGFAAVTFIGVLLWAFVPFIGE